MPRTVKPWKVTRTTPTLSCSTAMTCSESPTPRVDGSTGVVKVMVGRIESEVLKLGPATVRKPTGEITREKPRRKKLPGLSVSGRTGLKTLTTLNPPPPLTLSALTSELSTERRRR